MIKQEFFDVYNGENITKYILYDKILTAEIIDLGAAVVALKVAAKDQVTDVALNFTDAKGVAEEADYMGAIVGRVANRTESGRFHLNGKEYILAKNSGTEHLHGGNYGFNRKKFDAKINGGALELTYVSADKEENYPGQVTLTVKYEVSNGALVISYFAKSDADTLLSVTNHLYFNLDGENVGSVYDNTLWINASHYTPVKPNMIPTGEIRDVTGTVFDFRTPKKIGRDIDKDDEQLLTAGGYDHNFCVDGTHVAEAYSEKTKIKMDVYSDRPGVQFYSGNFLTGKKGKSVYGPRSGFCLETQTYPNAINTNGFEPKPILKKGEEFFSKTEYVFSVK